VAGEYHASATCRSQCVAPPTAADSQVYEQGVSSDHFAGLSCTARRGRTTASAARANRTAQADAEACPAVAGQPVWADLAGFSSRRCQFLALQGALLDAALIAIAHVPHPSRYPLRCAVRGDLRGRSSRLGGFQATAGHGGPSRRTLRSATPDCLPLGCWSSRRHRYAATIASTSPRHSPTRFWSASR
jgi:hypothetical protein